MKHFINTLKIVVFLLAGSLYAQQEPNYALYQYTMNVINPAYAGADGQTSIAANLRSQWEGVRDAPETQSLFFTAPLKNRVGIGLSVVNDATFIERKTGYFVDFSYKVPISAQTNVFLGLKAGGDTYSLDTNNLANLGFPQDPAVQNIDEGFKPNVGIGAYLHNEKYFLSLSAPSLLSADRVDVSNGSVTNKNTHVYLSGGYSFDLGGETQFKPSTMARYVSGAPISVDITAAFRFLDKLELGVLYRTDKALGGIAKFELHDWLDIGYGYESSLRSEISNVSRGTHEIFVRFNIANNN